MLPLAVRDSLRLHLESVRALQRRDLSDGFGTVYLPEALARKYPAAEFDWAFPAHDRSRDPRTGLERRHHLHETTIQKAVRKAARAAGIPKLVSPHALRPVSYTH